MEKFHYKSDSGQEVVLPKFADLVTFGFVRKIRKLPQTEQVFELVEAAADEAALAVLDAMKNDEIERFFTAWQEDSGVTLGESEASATS